MHVTNREPCTLIIGETKIGFGETKEVGPEWAARCEQLHALGALHGHGGLKDDRPSRAMTPAELFAAMSPAEQRAAIAQVRAATERPADAAAPATVTDPPTAPIEVPAVPAGAPADFHTGHHNKALAFVRKCNDAALLTALGNEESRESVLAAIIDRVQALEPKAN